MKVLWIAPLPYLKNPKGHPAPWIMSLSKLLSTQIELTILVCNSEISSDESFLMDGIEYIYLKSPRGSIDLLTLHKRKIGILRNFLINHYQQYDIVHIHGSEHQFEQACWDLPIPKLLSIQGIIGEYYKHISDKVSFRRASWYLTKLSEQNYLPYIQNFMCRTTWDKNWVNDNIKGAIINHCWEAIRPDFFQINFDFTVNSNILYLGGTNDLKGYKEALIAFDIVSKANRNIKLIYVSSNKRLASKIINRIKSEYKLYGLNDSNVKIYGFLDTAGVVNAFSESYCLLHPSYIDNSPNSICEAQVAGLPVVASDVGGVNSLIIHKSTGLLTSLVPEQIAESLLSIYNDKIFARTLSEQAKTEARKRHDSDSIRDTTFTIYSKVIKAFHNQSSLQAV